MMDPDVLYDLLNSVTNTATLNSVTNTATLTKLVITADTDPADVKEHILNYAQTAQDYDLLTVVTILSKVSENRRSNV